jgi:RNA polymerase sigma-70 factor (ECF subfamily)
VNDITGNNREDKLLVNRVLNGDSQAFGLIIRQSEKIVAHVTCKMIHNEEDRKDIAQDIYLKAFKNLPKFKFESKLSTWIARIAFNTCMDQLRKKKLVLEQELVNTDAEDADFYEGSKRRYYEDDNTVASKLMEQKALTGILKTEIENLPPVSRTLITLFHNVELSYEEIGEITGMPSGTVKSYLYRARKALKNNLLAAYKKEDL